MVRPKSAHSRRESWQRGAPFGRTRAAHPFPAEYQLDSSRIAPFSCTARGRRPLPGRIPAERGPPRLNSSREAPVSAEFRKKAGFSAEPGTFGPVRAEFRRKGSRFGGIRAGRRPSPAEFLLTCACFGRTRRSRPSPAEFQQKAAILGGIRGGWSRPGRIPSDRRRSRPNCSRSAPLSAEFRQKGAALGRASAVGPISAEFQQRGGLPGLNSGERRPFGPIPAEKRPLWPTSSRKAPFSSKPGTRHPLGRTLAGGSLSCRIPRERGGRRGIWGHPAPGTLPPLSRGLAPEDLVSRTVRPSAWPDRESVLPGPLWKWRRVLRKWGPSLRFAGVTAPPSWRRPCPILHC